MKTISRHLIIFDFDGTLVDTRADLNTAINLMREEYQLPPLSRETVTSFVGNGAAKLVQRSLPGTAISIDDALASFKKHYAQHLTDETCLYEGVYENLEQLKVKGFALAIVTNKPETPARQICEKLGITHFFDVLLGGDSCPTLKPDPGPLHIAMQAAACGSKGSWIVGDNYTDMAAGRKAGLQRCFCAYGFGHLRGENYDLNVSNLSAFVNHVLR